MLITQIRTKGLWAVHTERNSCKVTQLGAEALNHHWKNIYGFQVKSGSLIRLGPHNWLHMIILLILFVVLSSCVSHLLR